jgi:uncharacterized protein (TIGR02117 family)
VNKNNLKNQSSRCPKLGWVGFTGVVTIATLLIMGYFTPRKWVNTPKTDCHYPVCLANVGVHTNIIVPIRNPIFDWQQRLGLRELKGERANSFRYLSFGWGDRLFYMQTPTPADFKLTNALDALLTPGPAVMYVEGYAQLPQGVELKCVKVDRRDYLNLMAFIQASFQTDPQQRAMRAGDGYNANASFYEAHGRYSVLRTCNTWTAESLRAADFNTPLWDATSAAVMHHFSSPCQ